MEIDEVDTKILRMLIKDARTNLTAIAKNCSLSVNAIHKRVRRLKAAGVITGTIVFITPALFGLEQIVTVGVNLESKHEEKVTNLIRKFAYLIHIDRSIGKYDICAFVIAKDLAQIELLKESIRKQIGVRKIAVNFWGKTHFNFENISLLQTRVDING